jgi:hypothetical protein
VHFCNTCDGVVVQWLARHDSRCATRALDDHAEPSNTHVGANRSLVACLWRTRLESCLGFLARRIFCLLLPFFVDGITRARYPFPLPFCLLLSITAVVLGRKEVNSMPLAMTRSVDLTVLIFEELPGTTTQQAHSHEAWCACEL